jgi:myosin heavy subunit
MLIGKFPTKEFLQRFHLEDTYWGIAEACMRGDISSLEKSIETNMQVFIRSGVYFALEKLRYLTLRNLFKKISICIGNNPEFKDKAHIIPLSIPF